jgi:cytochrome P450
MNRPSEICARLYDLARSHNGRNVTLTLNDVDVLVLQRIEEADHVLRRNAGNYRKNMAWFRQTLGPSRFSEDGRAWEIRKVLTHAYFTKFDRERATAIALRHAQATLRDLAEDSATTERLNDDRLRVMTTSVLVDQFLGIDFAETGIDIGLLTQLMECASEYSFVPQGGTARIYRDTMVHLPELRRRVLATLGCFRRPEVPRSALLDGLLVADARKSDRVVLEHEMVTFLAAGAETSAATMSWACYLLARHPALQERLRAAVLAAWGEGEPGWAQLSALEPLTAFVSETLRLYPPTPIIARIATEPDELAGIPIAVGQNVLVSFIGIQHDARFNPAPWSIDLDGGTGSKVAGDTVAFSFGPRVCGGKHFALVELAAFLAQFLRLARFELTSEAEPVFHWKSQMLREGGQPVRVVRLDPEQVRND